VLTGDYSGGHVFAPLRHVARFVRLALVCLALVWSSAPATATSITDVIALVAVNREAVGESARLAEPSHCVARAAEPAARVAAGEPVTTHRRAARAPSLPRRLYLEHRALLC
jgi:hypothetical protein